MPEPRAAMVTLPLDLLAKLLQLPEGARIDLAHYDPTDYSSVRLRVIGAGWPTFQGSLIQTASARIHEYRDDDGRCFKRVIEWDLPSNAAVSGPLRRQGK